MKFFGKKKKSQKSIQIIEDLVCYCFRVHKDEIVTIIKEHKCRTVDAVKMHCSACEGCGGCRPEIEDLIHECFSKRE
ncbi:(2Fe-2S)-binding protein [Candidatus Uabimicrobium sp. HlEnr_7]|uniref:(2Fe-2S)-binding protein n=1 Tax=Candidatus Uabimicrobium helgolandensis TaxID=3095367 RepID=UPI003557164B